MNAISRIITLCGGLFTLAAQAGVSYTTNPTGAAWIGSPNYVSANNANFATLSTAQGDPAITGANGLMAETFTPSSSFILGSFNLIMQVTLATNFSIHLYNLGPAGTVSVNSAAATYTPGADLFSGLSFSPATSTGSVQAQFTLSGVDQVALLANEEYALEIWTPAGAQNGFLWYRGSVADPGGQMFSGGDNTTARNTLAGNGQAGGAPRTAGLALYGVPEPSAISLCGLGLLALIDRKRR
ncbi:MAG TPA: hypothetical protein VLT36_26110 [Candidatus Dormibacteraeota bacterium]|nr:hypothetical protein [Candidatus Dormibacteraeota bacterium]